MNLDIETVHLQIIQHLQHPKENAVDRHRLEELRREFLGTPSSVSKLSHSVVTAIHKEIHQRQRHLEQMDDSSLLHFYLLYAVPLIEKYKTVASQKVRLHFMQRHHDDQMQTVQRQKQAVIQEYLQLVQRMSESVPFLHDVLTKIDTPLPITTPSTASSNNMSSQPLVCESCANAIHFDIFDNHSVCRECGMVIDQFQNHVVSHCDIERVNISSKYTYDRRTHFRDCFYQFQGKQNVTIPQSLYDQITKQLLAHDIIPHNYKDLPKEQAFEKVEKEHISIFLRDSKFVKHYEDTVLIYHTLTGKPVPDLAYLEEELMKDFDELVEQYDRKFKDNTERKNFINTQYVLFQLLRRHKYPCQKEDFNILKTIDRKYYHDEICSQLFADLGWNFQPLF